MTHVPPTNLEKSPNIFFCNLAPNQSLVFSDRILFWLAAFNQSYLSWHHWYTLFLFFLHSPKSWRKYFNGRIGIGLLIHRNYCFRKTQAFYKRSLAFTLWLKKWKVHSFFLQDCFLKLFLFMWDCICLFLLSPFTWCRLVLCPGQWLVQLWWFHPNMVNICLSSFITTNVIIRWGHEFKNPAKCYIIW